MVLVIDDEAYVREVVIDILDFAGYEALGAASGEEGLRLFDANQGKVRVVLLDMKMPGLSGPETLQRLRAVAPSISVVLCSGLGEFDSTINIADDPKLSYLRKPYTMEALVDMVKIADEQTLV
jgi:DNA-binding NtrC family response regulator